jgi:hypothetical protein
LVYDGFIDGILKTLKFKQYAMGEFLCHKYDIGMEMYFILEGKLFSAGNVGVLIEETNLITLLEKQKAEAELVKIFKSSSEAVYDELTVKKELHFRSAPFIQEYRRHRRQPQSDWTAHRRRLCQNGALPRHSMLEK